VLICFDPGHVWSVERSAATLEILRLSDFVLLNSREFEELGAAPVGLTVVKRPHGVVVLRDGAEVGRYSHRPLREDEIRDATGAGDVFAAGLLAGVLSGRSGVCRGARLGMELARHKLRHVGSGGHADFADLADAFMRPDDA
ncbi:PfkB family carbohydrate kinase, partial [Micromonosporaceae bacterium Da 78-11]